MSIWEKFNDEIDVEGLLNNDGEYKKVPHGKYEVKIEKLECGTSKTNKPMMVVWFKIVAGEYKNSMLFYNQVLTNGVGLMKAKHFLKSLKTGFDIKFRNLLELEKMINESRFVLKELELEFALDYRVNQKGFDEYEIYDVFED